MEKNSQEKKSFVASGRLSIRKTTLRAFLALLFYKIALDASYYLIISRVWSYSSSGFFMELNLLKLFESYVLLTLIFWGAPKAYKNISDLMIWLLILLSYIPLLTIYAFMDQPRIYMYAVTGFWALVFLLMKLPAVKFNFFKKKQSTAFLFAVFSLLMGLVLFLFFKYLGFSYNFDLTKVYEIRSAYVNLKIPFSGYLFNWVAYVVNPIAFALFIKKRNWFLAGLVALFQIFLFSSTGLKTYLFTLPFVLILMWIIKKKNPFAWLGAGMATVVIAGMLSYLLIGDLWTTSLFARRTLLVPAQLSFMYYDFFAQNEHIFLSQHPIIPNFIKYPYDLEPPHLIAAKYFDKPEMNANNGIYADAYMNFGFIGFLFWGIILVILFKLFDSFARGKDKFILAAAIAMPSIVFVNSALLTCLLTHGVLLSMLMVYLLPKERIKNLL